MKNLTAIVVSALLVGSVCIAADAEKSASDTSDTSKNPITGTVTTTHKAKRLAKAPNGKIHKIQATDTVKTKKNGAVDETLKVEDKTEPAK